MTNIFQTMSTTIKGDRASETDIKAIPPYIFCRWLSGNPNTVSIANLLNCFYNIPIDAQYDFVRSILHNNIKFIKYPKSDNEENGLENIKYICDYYKVNQYRAKEYLEAISKEELDKIIRAYKIMESRK